MPVTMGARESRESEYGLFRFTSAAFPAREVLERHTHARVTFAVILDGGFDLLIGGRRLACTAGTAFTEPAEETHANEIGTGGARVLVVQPSPDAGFPAPCARLLDRVSHLRNEAISRIARRLARELGDPDEITPLESQALALEMLAAAARLELTRARQATPPAWIRRVEELLHDRFREPVTIDELAAEAGVHAAHFTRVFRERHGTSPGRYVRGLRLTWAAERLRTSSDPISRVALQAGFADQAHFTRAFRRHWGVPPGRYRALRSPGR